MLARTSLLLCTIVVVLSSCAPTAKDPKQQLIQPTPASPVATAPVAIIPSAPVAAPPSLAFSATSMSISVLSQIDYRSSPPSVDVRVECRDQMNDLCKGVGLLRMKLTGSLPSQVEYAFEVPLTTLAEQSARWENVTSTYIARLAPPWADTLTQGSVVRVTATLERGDGSTLTAKSDVR